jgi:hypothetical protein
MRIATYNVEWFANLFDRNDALIEDDGPSGRWGISRGDQLAALGHVFRAIDADAVLIVEAPDTGSRASTVRALENFAQRFDLRTNRALIGFPSETQQEIALLYDPSKLTARHDPQNCPTNDAGGEPIPRFDREFRIDLDLDGTPERIAFSKPPLELDLRTAAGFRLRMIGVHAKSKAWRGNHSGAEALRRAIANRRTQYAQCLWLRARIDAHLAKSDPLIVLGDLNDGPGLDEYEKLFSHSGVEIVMGEGRPFEARLHDPNARRGFADADGPPPASARFRAGVGGGEALSALVDYILISHDLCARNPVWRIWHPEDDPAIAADEDLRLSLLVASDHFPVTLNIDL